MSELEFRKFIREILLEKWTKKYKKSIDCSHPKGFSQKAHCAARKKRQRGEKTKYKSPFNESKQIQEQEIFDRVNFYLEYYTNNSPSSFKVIREGDEIKILNII